MSEPRYTSYFDGERERRHYYQTDWSLSRIRPLRKPYTDKDGRMVFDSRAWTGMAL